MATHSSILAWRMPWIEEPDCALPLYRTRLLTLVVIGNFSMYRSTKIVGSGGLECKRSWSCLMQKVSFGGGQEQARMVVGSILFRQSPSSLGLGVHHLAYPTPRLKVSGTGEAGPRQRHLNHFSAVVRRNREISLDSRTLQQSQQNLAAASLCGAIGQCVQLLTERLVVQTHPGTNWLGLE